MITKIPVVSSEKKSKKSKPKTGSSVTSPMVSDVSSEKKTKNSKSPSLNHSMVTKTVSNNLELSRKKNEKTSDASNIKGNNRFASNPTTLKKIVHPINVLMIQTKFQPLLNHRQLI